MATPNKVDKGTAKVVSINPLMKDGQQEKYKDWYKSVVKLDNGIEGNVNSKESTPPYKIGDEVDYEAKYYGQDNQFVNMSVKTKDSGKPRGRNYHDPVKNWQITKQVALEWAIEYQRLIGDNGRTSVYSEQMFAWLQSQAPHDEKDKTQERINAQSALKRAVQSVAVDPDLQNKESFSGLLNKASMFLQYITEMPKDKNE